MIPLVYLPRYNVTLLGLERIHPFDSRKYERIHRALIARGVRKPSDFIRPRPANTSDLEQVHAADYLASLREAFEGLKTRVREVEPSAPFDPALVLVPAVFGVAALAGVQ